MGQKRVFTWIGIGEWVQDQDFSGSWYFFLRSVRRSILRHWSVAAWAILEKDREIRKHLDSYAVPRLIIPSGWGKDQRVGLELLAQLALIAAKEGVLKLSDKAAILFREYCSGVASYYLNRLEEEDKNAVIDRIFERLYLKGRPGRGIMALDRAHSFRSYIKEAIRWEIANLHKGTKVSQRSGTGPPGSIAEGAEILEVPFSTVWRHMRKLGLEHWTSEAWNEIQQDFQKTVAIGLRGVKKKKAIP